MRKALKDVLYGRKSRLDIDRLVKLADAFTSFTTNGLQADASVALQRQAVAAGGSSSVADVAPSILDPAAKEALLMVFSPRGSYVQVGFGCSTCHDVHCPCAGKACQCTPYVTYIDIACCISC